MNSKNRFDFLVLGSSFSGSLTAIILAKAGYNVAVLEKSSHPRFAIGESSTPIANMLLRDLAIQHDLSFLLPFIQYGSWRDQYPEVAVGLKRGFTYLKHQPGEVYHPGQTHQNELLVSASVSDKDSDTHWFRADFDHFLFSKLREHGVRVYSKSELMKLERLQGNWSIEYISDQDSEFLEAGFIIDASGSGATLNRMIGIGQNSDCILSNTSAIYSHFVGVVDQEDLYLDAETKDHPYSVQGSAVHHLMDEKRWMWMLNFSNGITSAGIVTRNSSTTTPYPSDWKTLLVNFPSLSRLFSKAELAKSPGRLIASRRLQRRLRSVQGDSWALLPGTFGFVDPLHSTGIAWSLHGIQALTNILIQGGESSLKQGLRLYERNVEAEFDLIDRLCFLCYSNMDDFEKWIASCMLYFALSIAFENHLSSASSIRDDTIASFLHADSSPLSSVLEAALAKCKDPDYGEWLENALKPFNEVGLFRPTVANMYHHTAARI